MNKLHNYINNKNASKNTNLKEFNLLLIYLGAKPTLHFPKLKDNFGKVIKDFEGTDKRSEEPDGYLYTFSELGSSKLCKVLLKEDKMRNLKVLSLLELTGLGYDISRSNLIYVEEVKSIKPMEEEKL